MSKLQEAIQNTRPTNDERPLEVLEMEDEKAATIFETLGSDTTYRTYKALQTNPKVPQELAAELDTSIQNIHYHLNKLEDVDLITPADTWVSEKGVEMNVYAPTHNPLVISFASRSDQDKIHSTLSRVFGGIAITAFVSLLAEIILYWQTEPTTPYIPASAGDSGTPDESHIVLDAILAAPGLTLFLFGVMIVSTYAAYRLSG